MTCELCNLEKKTKWYYESDYFIVCDCAFCKVPMIVSKRHTIELNQEEMIDLMWIISYVLEHMLPEGEGKIHFMLATKLDQRRRKVLDHWHVHIR